MYFFDQFNFFIKKLICQKLLNHISTDVMFSDMELLLSPKKKTLFKLFLENCFSLQIKILFEVNISFTMYRKLIVFFIVN